DRSLRPVYTQRQSVLLAGRDLADRQHALAAALEAQQHVDVLVKHPVGQERTLVGTQLGHRVASDVLEQVEAMTADVTERAAHARLGRVGTPGGLLLPELL